MLTADLIRPFLRPTEQTLSVALLDEQDAYWLQTAEDLIACLQSCMGQSRAKWEAALEILEGARIDYQRVRGLAKVLTDDAIFVPRSTSVLPFAIRMALFREGPVCSDQDRLPAQSRQDILQKVALDMGMTAEDVDAGILADLPQEHLLTRLKTNWTPLQLIQRYNLELTRGALYRATVVVIDVWDNYKTIWSYLKLFNIMYWVEILEDEGYRVTLSGPLADFVRTERYGIAFAQFLPALLLGERWQMTAKVQSAPGSQETEKSPLQLRERSLTYQLDQDCALSTHYRQGREYDSSLERIFAQEFVDFEARFGAERGGWLLQRESELLVLDRTVMIPDFCLEHREEPNRRILVELMGFWTPRYLRTKLAKLRKAQCEHMIVLVYERLNVTVEDFEDVASEVIFFKEKPIIKQLMPVVEALADRIYGPLPPSKRRKVTSGK